MGANSLSASRSLNSAGSSVFDFQRTATASSARSSRRREKVQKALSAYVGASLEAERSLRRLWASQQLKLPFWSDAAMPTSQLENPAAATRVAKLRSSCA